MKTKALLKASLLSAGLCCFPATSSAVLIDFQGLAGGTEVTNQFPEATFASVGGQVLVTDQPAYAGTGGRFICTGSGGQINCDQSFTVTFTNAVSNLTFDSVGDNQGNGDVGGKVDVFVNNVLSATVDIIGDGVTFDTDLVDLSAFNNVTAIRIHSVVDPAGLGFDNFSFNVARVPEPSSLLLLGAGLFGWLSSTRRLRK